jgi:uncharacterized coiled-coil DUF342 family protein
MQTAMLNTLEYVKLLTSIGFTQSQAEGLNEAQNMATHAILSQVATSADIKDFRATSSIATLELRTEINELRTEMHAEFRNVHAEFKNVRGEINELRTEMYAEFKNVRGEINELRTEMHAEFKNVYAEFKNVRAEMHKEIAELKNHMTYSLFMFLGGVATLLGIGLTVQKYFI